MNTYTSTATNAVTNGSSEWIKLLFENAFVQQLGKVLLAIVVVGALLFLSKVIANRIKNRITKTFAVQDPDVITKIGSLISDLVFYFMGGFSLYIGFKIIGIDIDRFVGGISIGIGFAFRELLSNLIAGIMIFATKEFRIGDIIEVADKQLQVFGRIEEITIRYIMIKTFDLRKVVIPNVKFMGSPVKTYTAEDVIRMDFDTVIDMESDFEHATTVIQEAINALPFVLRKELTDVTIDHFTESKIAIKVLFAFDPNGTTPWHIVKSKVQQATMVALKQHNFIIK